MPIDFLLPKPFKPDMTDAAEHQSTRRIIKRNQFYSIISGLVAAIFFITAAYISCMSNEQGNVILLKIFLLMMFATIFFSISTYTGTKVGTALKPNYFQIRHTSFYIAISNKELKLLIKHYFHSTSKKSKLGFDHYNVYADIYNEMVDYTTRCFIGQMKNGQLITVDNYGSDYELATKEMITTINSYALYIRKHHLESEFADSATLRFSTKYLDKNYKPMLVMKNKDGKVLHLKQYTSNLSDNVICSNETEKDEKYAN